MLVWLAVLALGAGFSGCGESAPEKYISDADAICRTLRAEYRALDDRYERVPLDAFYRLMAAADSRLRRLSAPEEIRPASAAYLSINRQKLRLIERALRRRSEAVQQRILDSPEAQRLGDRASALAKDVGFKVCS